MSGVIIDSVGGVGSKIVEEVNSLVSTTATFDTGYVAMRRSSSPQKY